MEGTVICCHAAVPRSYQVKPVLHGLTGDRKLEERAFPDALQLERIAVMVCLHEVPLVPQLVFSGFGQPPAGAGA